MSRSSLVPVYPPKEVRRRRYAVKLAEEFGDDPGKIMLKVDFSNAFSLVDRTETGAGLRETSWFVSLG